MELSIIIPAYNEEGRIGAMLQAYLPFFAARYGAEVELIVVVNGSTDATAAVVGRLAGAHAGLRCLVEPRPIGKGGALILGFSEARGRIVGFCDADGSTPPEAFLALVQAVTGGDAVIASRWLPGAEVHPRQPPSRRLASRVFNRLVRGLFGLRLTDTQCGAKAFDGQLLKAVLPSLGITRWAFDVDLLYQFKRRGASIREVPTVWRDVQGSKLRIPRASLEMFMALIRLRLLYSPFRGLVNLYNARVFPFSLLPKPR